MTNGQPKPTTTEREREAARSNRDPISNAPGSHPVGTGVGAAAGSVVGLGVGAVVGGPIGAAVGAAVGAVAGGLTGKTAAEAIDPTVEEAYWRENYRSRPYVDANAPFDLYAPAYRLGWESRMARSDRGSSGFEQVENELAEAWKKTSAKTSLGWEKAKLAVRDAWDRRAIDRAEGEGMPPRRAPQSVHSSAPHDAPHTAPQNAPHSAHGTTRPDSRVS